MTAASASVENANWIPAPFQRSAQSLARDAVKKYLRANQVVGLGSGPMAAAIVREMAEFDNKETLECVATSYQIKLEAQCSGLKIVDEGRIPEIEVMFDGADEVDQNLDMIKGGGGALLREKILHTAAKTIVIAAESPKFVQKFSWPVPIEVHPFAISLARKALIDAGGFPRQRMLKEGYPYVTENGNFILDTRFDSVSGPSGMETRLKDISGIVEVGLFTRHADTYYKARDDGSFEIIKGQARR